MEYLGIIQLAGKYVFLAALYAFIIWIFRSLFAVLKTEQAMQKRQEPQAAPAAPPERPRNVQRPPHRPTRSRPPARPQKPRPAPAPEPKKPRLVVADGGESGLSEGTEFPLTAAVTIGRDNDNALTIPERYVSGEHAMIFLKDDMRILRDRNSTNGTTRNGRPVDGDVVLKDGDIIGIGTVKLRYESGA
ncbi:MAG: FHA domain-containing protein [Armatimonadota bacterium]